MQKQWDFLDVIGYLGSMAQVLLGVNTAEQLKMMYWNTEPEGCPPGSGFLANAKPGFYLRFENLLMNSVL